ncbi:hypothetical protein BU15DRAFT_90007 [Melanogaster broomeanus]|nr:hypothetical protein BU15DRAFT_90007 [Melanogaster broomeanus]
MASPFAFVPRTVSKHAVSRTAPSAPKAQRQPPPPSTDSSSEDETTPSISPLDKGKGKAAEPPSHKQSNGQDIAALVSLSLSDYNIWLDADLRRKLEESLKYAESTEEDGAGCIPVQSCPLTISSVRSPFRGSLSSEPSETEVVKALRTYASDTLEVRMLVSAPSSSIWYGPGKTSRKKDVGGYEVRRTDWAGLPDHPSRSSSDARAECVPTQYRTIAGIARFAEALLPSLQSHNCGVQSVTLPPHYLDKPGDIPKCKGYALVTFSTRDESESLLQTWLWRRCLAPVDRLDTHDIDMTLVDKEALKFGFRTMSKARWDQLNEEYLIYKQRLIDEMGEADEPPACTSCSSNRTWRACSLSANKTTLKALFSQAFQAARCPANGLDYVDFQKGMDTCYLRLASPHYTTLLMEYFIEHVTVHAHGLDATGRRPTGDDKPISVEIIQGKKEELYWEKVPEKVRRQAVDKAVKAQYRATSSCLWCYVVVIWSLSVAVLTESLSDSNESFTEFVGTFAQRTFTPVSVPVRIHDISEPGPQE